MPNPNEGPAPFECDRRAFFRRGLSCAAYLGLASALAPMAVRRAFAAPASGRLRHGEPWGRIEEVGEGLWALVSTPLSGGQGAMRTIANGGIIAGREGVLVVEAFASAEGALWMAERARELTGRPVTHVVITHHHGDHAAGRGGYAELPDPPRVMTTPVTRDRLEEKADAGERGGGVAPPLPEGSVPAHGEETVLDLGGRKVRITPRAGHTASDLTVRPEDSGVLWCGDLVWNGLFPNYMDARPSVLHQSVRSVVDREADVYVPGHGGLADQEGLRAYLQLLEDVEEAARRAVRRGVPAERAAREYRPPEALGEWALFSDDYYAVAFRAWARELTPPPAQRPDPAGRTPPRR